MKDAVTTDKTRPNGSDITYLLVVRTHFTTTDFLDSFQRSHPQVKKTIMNVSAVPMRVGARVHNLN